MPISSRSPATAAAGRLLVLAVPDGQHLVVLVAGGADRRSAPLLRTKIVDSLCYRPRTLDVDATDLTSCDASGLAALLDAVETAERSGVQVTIQPSAQLAWLLATAEPSPRTSGQPRPDPAGCPLPGASAPAC